MELVVIWILLGILTAGIASSKGRNGCGWFLLGVLFGPFAVLGAIFAPKDRPGVEKKAIESGDSKKCPFCAELIKAEAVKCRYCGEQV